MATQRPSRLITWMRIAQEIAEQSTCIRRKVGCIAVKDGRMIASGYNGQIRKHPHCSDGSCRRQQLNIPSGQALDICRAIHAEQNVIVQAATSGHDLTGADIYCTTMPCHICMRLLLNCSIQNIYFTNYYPSDEARQILRDEHSRMGDDRTCLYEVKLFTNEAGLPDYSCTEVIPFPADPLG